MFGSFQSQKAVISEVCQQVNLFKAKTYIIIPPMSIEIKSLAFLRYLTIPGGYGLTLARSINYRANK
jgi:hypothetical protein